MFYYMNYGLFENVPMLDLSLKDSLLDLQLTAQFFFFFSSESYGLCSTPFWH